jgi:apolipoprotein N-acyltransferase
MFERSRSRRADLGPLPDLAAAAADHGWRGRLSSALTPARAEKQETQRRSLPHHPIRSSPHYPIKSSPRYGLALLSGLLLPLCFPAFDLGWLVWLALVPLFLALLGSPAPALSRDGSPGLQRPTLRQGTGLGFVAGAVFLGGHLYWVWIFGWYAWLALTLYQALWIALFGALAVVLLRRVPPGLEPPVMAAAWTVVEWARSLGLLGLTWGDLAVSQHRTLPVLQMLDWTGPWGLTFLIALVNASVAGAVSGQQSAVSRGAGWRWLAGALVVVGLLTARGAWLLAAPAEGGGGRSNPGHQPETLPVAVVQGNIDQDVLWDAEFVRRALSAHARLTLAAARHGARLVVWSETSLPGELRHDPVLRAAVSGLARAAKAELIVGSNDHIGRRAYNRAFLVDRQGWLRGGYAKRQLVPYGECVPLRPWLPFLEKLHVTAFDLTPGEGFYPLRGEHRLGCVICFESAFPHISRAMAGKGAEILVEVTDDTWFGRTAAAAQHAAMAPLRAVETRRSLARATATGISTLVDDHGRVRRQLGLFQEGYLLARLPLRREITPYVRLGDWPVLLSLLICAATLGYPGASAVRRWATRFN